MFISILLLLFTVVQWNDASRISPMFVDRRQMTEKTVGSSIHFGDDRTQKQKNNWWHSNTKPYQGSSTVNDEGDDDDGQFTETIYGKHVPSSSYGTATYSTQSEFEQPPLLSLARGSNSQDSFRIKSEPTYQQFRPKTQRKFNRVNFSNGDDSDLYSTRFRARAKRSPMIEQRRSNYPRYPMPMPLYGVIPAMPQYTGDKYGYMGYKEPEEDCQYHTLVNGDSEVLLRKILPIRMRGRTLLRTCIPKPPAPNDPRYKVLLRGNNQSSFGHLSLSMKQ